MINPVNHHAGIERCPRPTRRERIHSKSTKVYLHIHTVLTTSFNHHRGTQGIGDVQEQPDHKVLKENRDLKERQDH